MLPDISFRYKIKDKINRRDYDSKMIHKIAAMKDSEFDGCTTPNAKGIVMGLNEYLENSSETIFYVFAGIGFYKSIHQGEYDNSEIPFLKFYSDPVIKKFAKRNEHLLWNIARSMASQRRLVRLVKQSVKKNRINKAWEDTLYEFIKKLNDRNKYVLDNVMPEHIKFTPVYILVKDLESEGRNIKRYIESIKGDDDGLDVSKLCREVERFIVESVDDDQLSIWQDEMMNYVIKQIARDKANKEAYEKYMESENERIRERVASDINSVCGCVDKMAKERRRGRLKQLRDTVDAYVIVAARVSRSKEKTSIGYALGGGYPLTKDFDRATIFSSYDKALEVLKAIRENPDIIAEIAYIDNSDGRFIVA